MDYENLKKQLWEVNACLTERRLNTALSIIEGWIKFLKDHEIIKKHQLSIDAIRSNYYYTFQNFLENKDIDRENILDKLTYDIYSVSDNIFVDIIFDNKLIKEYDTIQPKTEMSIFLYYCNRLYFDDNDSAQMQTLLLDKDMNISMSVVLGLSINACRCFSYLILHFLIECLTKEMNGHTLLFLYSMVIVLLAIYDDRIDLYPALLEMFEDSVNREQAMQSLAHLFSIQDGPVDFLINNTQDKKLKSELKSFIYGNGDTSSSIDEREDFSLMNVLRHFSETWVCQCIIDDEEERSSIIEKMAINVGQINYCSGQVQETENILLQRLRDGSNKAYDYVNYGHCCLVRGDRVLAMEYYKKARSLCNSAAAFSKIFNMGSFFLDDNNVPVETVDLIEDQLYE